MKIKLFADGANLAEIINLSADPKIAGFTTNPTLMRKAGVTDYEVFARDVLRAIDGKPISFEVFADEPAEMIRQAEKIASWGENVYVKIPVTNTRGMDTLDVISELTKQGIKVNVTAILSYAPINGLLDVLRWGAPAYLSIFAGRIADTGRDPMAYMESAVGKVSWDMYRNIEIIWASPREVLNVYQADSIGCHIITATPDILKKLSLAGKRLDEYSLETVKMFYEDAKASGYTL